MFPQVFLADIPVIFQWWGVLFLLGLLMFPLASLVFSSFIDKGYLFAKVFAITILSYSIFSLATLQILAFQLPSLMLLILFFILFTLFLLKKQHMSFPLSSLIFILAEESMFLVCLVCWSYVRGTQPDIQGLEKFMDFGFVNTILRSDFFPPKDMWFTPHTINYYYFGHLITAVLTSLSLLPAAKTYNLMIATLFAFCFSLSFSLGVNLMYLSTILKGKITHKYTLITITGILTAAMTTLAGNLHTVYTFFTPYQNGNPVLPTKLSLALTTFPNSYWYPNATRFIYNTIHEFPMYSFVVADLHGHVLGIPIVLTIIALLTNIYFSKKIKFSLLSLYGFFIAIAYMTNVWDSLIYLFLAAATLFVMNIQKEAHWKNSFITTTKQVGVILLSFIIFSLPFSLFFKPFGSGIGVLCAPSLLTAVGHIGPFLFEADHCQQSPLWQLIILHGFFYFFVLSYLMYLFFTKKITHGDILVLLLIAVSTLLIIAPEFIYVKDIYPAHYRANTMFKLIYQSFIMLSLVSSFIFVRLLFLTKRHVHNFAEWVVLFLFLCMSLYLFVLVFLYPYFALQGYYGQFTYKGIDGTTYLKRVYPDDYQAIQWLQKHVKRQPIILESQGDSYTDHARISANTGLPTVLGWTVHEWLWRGAYDIPAPRISEIQKMYESPSAQETKQLLAKYNVSYVIVGSLEKQKYTSLEEQKFTTIGTVVFQKGETTIYKIHY